MPGDTFLFIVKLGAFNSFFFLCVLRALRPSRDASGLYRPVNSKKIEVISSSPLGPEFFSIFPSFCLTQSPVLVSACDSGHDLQPLGPIFGKNADKLTVCGVFAEVLASEDSITFELVDKLSGKIWASKSPETNTGRLC